MTIQQAPNIPSAPAFYSDLCQARARRFILIAAILASSMGFIDGSVVAIALPAMRASLGATLEQAQWFSNAYMLTLSALILVGGALGDRFGLVRIFSIGICFFVLASLACAVAPTSETLIIARCLKGIGAAFMIPGSLALISRTYPKEERGRAIGIWAAASALTTALGPIIGGVALTLGGDEMWRWIFAVNLPFGALALWLLWRHVQSDPVAGPRGIDLSGALLATAGLGLVAYALTATNGPTMIYGAAGAACLVGFILVELKSPHPMMPLGLFRLPGFAAANIATLSLYFALSAMLFFLPMTLIAGWGVTEIVTSAIFAPLSVFISTLSAVSGRLADRFGAGRMIAFGSLIVGLGYGLLAATMADQDVWFRVFPAMMLTGFGMAFVVAPLSAAVMGAVDDQNSGAASGVNNAISRIAGLLAVAAMGSLAASTYAMAGGLDSFGAASDTAGHIIAMNAAFARIAWICTGLCLISALIAFFGIPRPVTADQGIAPQ
ncbi:MFS transporter [Pseudaestuariivita rosea]|uniref:MFS transporter n=1 Tax=Pseudaestuariivita rosea TaxID=2763263 RepID=UPI001ABAE2E0|nr:MFS transporter [Pseudaestuariivita rosea]